MKTGYKFFPELLVLFFPLPPYLLLFAFLSFVHVAGGKNKLNAEELTPFIVGPLGNREADWTMAILIAGYG
jgi:hypothetical protein